MAVLEVGRAFDGLTVYPGEMSWSGGQLTLTGFIDCSGVANSADVLAACRDRVAALADGSDRVEEPVVPLVYSEDSSIDGFYRVESAQVGFPLHTQVTYGAPFQMTLTRFGGGSLPQVEVYAPHTVRTNSHSITNTTLNGSTTYPLIIAPTAVSEFWQGDGTAGIARVTASGSVSAWYVGSNVPMVSTATYTVAAGDYYDGACELRTEYGSAASQLVTGLHCPPAFDGMVLSNGLVRAFLHPSTATAFEVEVFDGSQWEDVSGGVGWRIEHDYGGGPSTQSWDLSAAKVTVIENSPIRVTIRLMLPEAATLNRFGRVWVDLSVRRGDPFVCGWVRTDEAGLVALEPTSSIAATALTGGIRATSNDAAGNRAVWGLANGSPSNNLTTGRITQTVGTTLAPFMVGVEIAGSSSSTVADDQAILYQFYDVRAESLRVVRR